MNGRMKIAIVPAVEEWMKKGADISKTGWPWLYALKQFAQKRDCEIDLIVEYENWNQIDLFLFMNSYDFHLPVYRKLLRQHLLHKCVYMMMEPNAVMYWHDRQYINKIHEFFPCIATQNTELFEYDCEKFEVPYLYNKSILYSVEPFENRKLLVNISGNKRSSHPDELYSERLRVINWFEENHPDEFDLYGFDWTGHVCNKGKCADKIETYHNYKFALCLENCGGRNNSYVTEKIFDCLRSGIVPIYKGPANIGELIPFHCYVDYGEFASLEELYLTLKGMDDHEYQKYLNEAKAFLNSDYAKRWSLESAYDDLLKINERVGSLKDWKITVKARMIFISRYIGNTVHKMLIYAYVHTGCYDIRKQMKNRNFKSCKE